MHELGIVIEIVKNVKNFAEKNGISKVDTLVLQVGELSPAIPQYIEECFPAAVDGTFMVDTKLKIEVLPGNALCKGCSTTYNLIENKGVCPSCGSKNMEVISGKELLIKEIIAC